ARIAVPERQRLLGPSPNQMGPAAPPCRCTVHALQPRRTRTGSPLRRLSMHCSHVSLTQARHATSPLYRPAVHHSPVAVNCSQFALRSTDTDARPATTQLALSSDSFVRVLSSEFWLLTPVVFEF
ncbi:hypothetical protein PIB30_045088, partial [Stylosanthes scabra]|nr:hypothetical protein [Stylosanthes scabra]